MKKASQSEIETMCKQLFGELRDQVTWKWDDWVGTILTEIDVGNTETIRGIINKFFPFSWDSSTINIAPQIVQSLDERLGGLRPTQLLFSADPSQDAVVFCAWWPWGNGSTISLRIGPFDENMTETEEGELLEKLKVLAGV